MSDADYTPTMSRVENGFAMYQLHANNDSDGYEQFRRTMAAHDAELAAIARRDALEGFSVWVVESGEGYSMDERLAAAAWAREFQSHTEEPTSKKE